MDTGLATVLGALITATGAIAAVLVTHIIKVQQEKGRQVKGRQVKGHHEPLRHCVGLEVIKENQLLGALAHPSRSGGSQPQQMPIAAYDPPDSSECGLRYVVSRGKAKGTVLRPHEQDGHYIVSPTRFEADYLRIPINEPIEPYLKQGLSLRMSAPGIAPSLISPCSILGRDKRRLSVITNGHDPPFGVYGERST